MVFPGPECRAGRMAPQARASRAARYEPYEGWQPVEVRLHAILADAAGKLEFLSRKEAALHRLCHRAGDLRRRIDREGSPRTCVLLLPQPRRAAQEFNAQAFRALVQKPAEQIVSLA